VCCYNESDSTIHVKESGISETPVERLNLNIYPNPFQNTANIEYTLLYTADVRITLIDVAGRQIDILPQIKQQPGNYDVEVNAEKYMLSPGLYQLKFITDNQSVARTFVMY